MDMDWREDSLSDLGSDLRSSIGHEFRRSAEEDEEAARHIRLRGRSLADAAHELMSRGDTVQLNFGAERFVGVVTHARSTLATIETQDGDEVHINLEGPVAIRVTKRATSGGRGGDPLGPDSFLARLRQLELDEATVVMAIPTIGETIVCKIEAVAADHLMVTDLSDQTWYVTFPQIAAVMRRG